MVRTILYVVAGVLLGLLIHLAVILTLPMLSNTDTYQRIADLAPIGKTTLLDAAGTPQTLSMRLDPDFDYAVCRLDLRDGPGELSGTLPDAFWSVAVYDRSGMVIYSTTNRDAVGQTLDLGVFDAAQTRLLAEQKIDVASGLLIVESRSDDIFVLVKLSPPQRVMLDRYRTQLGKLACRTLKT